MILPNIGAASLLKRMVPAMELAMEEEGTLIFPCAGCLEHLHYLGFVGEIER